jgi:hypothetical protein
MAEEPVEDIVTWLKRTGRMKNPILYLCVKHHIINCNTCRNQDENALPYGTLIWHEFEVTPETELYPRSTKIALDAALKKVQELSDEIKMIGIEAQEADEYDSLDRNN